MSAIDEVLEAKRHYAAQFISRGLHTNRRVSLLWCPAWTRVWKYQNCWASR